MEADRTLVGTQSARRQIILGYSGGKDSTVLLHALARSALIERFDLAAIHINHRLQEQSNEWEEFCRKTAAKLGVACRTYQVQNKPPAGDSVEAWARAERYERLIEASQPRDFIVTAHHLDDQLETFLLHLMRGAGPHGLSAIRQIQAFEERFLIRPLLEVEQYSIEEYAKKHELDFVSDPSNVNQNYDRNYLRHKITPLLRQRWPRVAENAAHSALIQQRLADEIDQRATNSLAQLVSNGGNSISLEPLRKLSTEHRFWIIRHWCKQEQLDVPDRRHALEIEKAIFQREPKATLLICWKNTELRYYDGRLILRPRQSNGTNGQKYSWDMTAPLKLPNGELRAIESAQGKMALRVRGMRCEVGFYQREGERCRPSGKRHSQSLKKLFQQWRVAPWARNSVPIIWVDGEIAAVVPHCVCEHVAAEPGEGGLLLQFSASELA